jgi:hypothetical protein
MTINDMLNRMTGGELAGWAVVLLILLMSLIEVSPLKLNPWDRLFAWFGRKINGETQKQLKELQKQVSDLWINAHRQSILVFARECRDDVAHDREEWNHILSVAEEYSVYCKSHNISNGVVKADTEYVRNLYQELSREHKI